MLLVIKPASAATPAHTSALSLILLEITFKRYLSK